MKKDKKYGFRKDVIKSIIGLSVKLDDSLEGLKREILILIVRFFIVIFTLLLVIYSIIRVNIVQILLFAILLLSSFLSWMAQIKKYRLIVSLRQLKELDK